MQLFSSRKVFAGEDKRKRHSFPFLFAVATAMSVTAGLPLLAQRTWTFSGLVWDVTPSSATYGPGYAPCWSDDPQSVWVDASGALHLKIRKVGLQWCQAQVVARAVAGYGDHRFQTTSRVDTLNASVVAGLYLYAQNPGSPDPVHHPFELDIEFAGSFGSQDRLWYTIQPSAYPYSPTLPWHNPITLTGTTSNADAYSTHRFNWTSSSVNFNSWYGHCDADPCANPIAAGAAAYDPNIPDASMKLVPMINLWINSSTFALSPSEQELIVSKYSGPVSATPVCKINCTASAPSSGQAGQSLSFTSSATPSNCSGSVSYSWNFGDGQMSGIQNPNHIYSSPGIYSWTLTTYIGSTPCQRTGNVTIESAFPQVCTSYTISPASQNPSAADGSQAVTLTGVPAGCTVGSWGASGNGSWLTADVNGPNTATVSWAANPGAARTGTATIADNTFTVNQGGTTQSTCTSFSIGPNSVSPNYQPGNQYVTIIGSPTGCQGRNWTASGDGVFVSVSPTSGSGSGGVSVSWAQNPQMSARTGYATIAGNTYTVNQGGGTQPVCASYTISPTSQNPSAAAGSQAVMVTGVPAGCTAGGWGASWGGWLTVSTDGISTATVSWTANSGPARTGTAIITNNTFTVNQAGTVGAQDCTSYTISPSSQNPSTAAGSQLVTVTGVPVGCIVGSWGAGWNDSWLSASLSWPGAATVTWSTNSGVARTGTVSIAGSDFTVNQSGVSSGGASRIYTVALCRVLDTRNTTGLDAASPALSAGETRTFTIGGRCFLPASAKALSVNQTVTGPTAPGELLLYRDDLPSAPLATSLMFRAGITRANNGILELAHDGTGTFKVFNNSSGTVHFILDVNGYFQ